MAQRKKNTHKKNRLPRRRLIAGVIVVGLVALLGTYYFGFSKAETTFSGVNFHFVTDEINNGTQVQAEPGMVYTTHIGGNIASGLNGTAMQGIAIISYDTRMVELVSTTCNHTPGCYASQVNTSTVNFSGSLHERRIAVCLNGPTAANTVYGSENFLTLKFKSKASFHAVYRNWISMVSGGALGNCSDNTTGAGLVLKNGYGNCSSNNYECDHGVSPGISNGDFIGFSTVKTGKTEDKTAQSDQANKSRGASSGSSQSSTSATSAQPSSSLQGDSTTQPTIKASPFYDGKLFEAGSESTAAIGTVSLGGKKYSIFLILISMFIIAAAASGVMAWKHWGRTKF